MCGALCRNGHSALRPHWVWPGPCLRVKGEQTEAERGEGQLAGSCEDQLLTSRPRSREELTRLMVRAGMLSLSLASLTPYPFPLLQQPVNSQGTTVTPTEQTPTSLPTSSPSRAFGTTRPAFHFPGPPSPGSPLHSSPSRHEEKGSNGAGPPDAPHLQQPGMRCVCLQTPGHDSRSRPSCPPDGHIQHGCPAPGLSLHDTKPSFCD